jgi:aminoglycoside phosphotransferase (APT) family kinase protein
VLLRLPRILAETQAALHQLDPSPLVDALGALPAGIERWVGQLADEVEGRAPELRPGLDWLLDHRPREPERLVICHGDIWPGNLLVDRGRVTGVLDWSLATVAEPAFDVGCTAMAFVIAPMDVSTTLARVVLPFSRGIAQRLVAAYRELTGADLSNQPW